MLVAPSDLIGDIDLDGCTEADLNRLPIGVIKLDAEGRVLFYNEAEAKLACRDVDCVIGRNFFTEVAPCARVPAFQGRFQAGVSAGALNEQFLFNFDFDMRPVKVSVQLRDAGTPGEYWVLTHVVDRCDAARPAQDRDAARAPDCIQPSGVLIIGNLDTGSVVGCSHNVRDLLRGDAGPHPGDGLADWLPEAFLARMAEAQASLTSVVESTLRLTGCPDCLRVRATVRAPLAFFELTVAAPPGTDHGPDAAALGEMIAALRQAPSRQALCDRMVKLLGPVTGFDRLFLCALDAEGHGRVVAEYRCSDRLPALAGRHLPAEDLAMAYGARNTDAVQLTPSREYGPVPVTLAETATDAARDLTGLHIAAVPPAQTRLHRQIGVNGALAVPLRAGTRPWGLLIGHHHAPHPLSPATQRAVSALADAFCGFMEGLEAREQRRRRRAGRGVVMALLEALSATEDIMAAGLAGPPSLLDLFDSCGAALIIDDQLHLLGRCPPAGLIRALIDHAAAHQAEHLWHSTCLARHLPAFGAYRAMASGAIAAFPAPDSGTAVIWFLPERVMTRAWAGRPYTAGGQAEDWLEVTEGMSAPVEEAMLDMCEEVRLALGEFLVRRGERLARLAEELAAGRARLASLLDSMVEAVLGCDTTGGIVSANAGAARLFGTAVGKLIGGALSDWFAAEDQAALQALIHAGDGEVVRLRVRREDGKVLPVDVTIGQWHDRDERNLVAVLRDQGEKVRLEQRAAQQSKLEALGQLAGSVAHDFNNFLSIVSGNLELAQMQVDDQAVLERLQAARHAVRRGSELTDRLLALVKRAPTVQKVQDLAAVIRAAEPLLQTTLGPQVSLVLALPPSPCWAAVETGQLENVLINLLNNARDAMPDGGKVQVALDQSGGRAVLSVTDTGSGMSPEVAARALDPFFTTKPTGKGTGLGLTTLNELAQSAGGEVKIDTEPGRGTTILLSLPQAAPEAAAAAPAPADPRLLLVEDMAPLRRVIADLLTHAGYAVTEAASSREALRLLRQDGPFDLLLTDILLGDADRGDRLALTALAEQRVARAVCITGDDSVLADAALPPDVPVLRKPFKLDAFLAHVRRPQ
ncbi:MAG: ATP-binding protein [Rhodothalassiaceae bacterium]